MNQVNLHFSSSDFERLCKAAELTGFTPNQLAKSWVLLTLNTIDMPKPQNLIVTSHAALHKTMMTALNDRHSGETFIVSSLFDPEVWASLDISSKSTLSQDLKKFVVQNPDEYIVVRKINNINQYKKL